MAISNQTVGEIEGEVNSIDVSPVDTETPVDTEMSGRLLMRGRDSPSEICLFFGLRAASFSSFKIPKILALIHPSDRPGWFEPVDEEEEEGEKGIEEEVVLGFVDDCVGNSGRFSCTFQERMVVGEEDTLFSGIVSSPDVESCDCESPDSFGSIG